MIDIATVVFREELVALKVQAQSIDLFCQDLGIKNIFVIVNDDPDLEKEIETKWWGQFESCVKIIHRNFFGQYFVENGWVSQQVLKILASSLSDNSHTMILDAKTIVTDKIKTEYFIDQHGLYTVTCYPIMPVFQRSAEITSDLFGIPVTKVLAPAGVPFVFHNRTVRDMIQEINSRTQQDFLRWFQDQGMLTEFILYSGYLTYKHGNLESICRGTSDIHLSHNICHSQTALFDHKLSMAKEPGGATIGVHRRAWSQLTLEQQKAYVDFLQSLGLTTAKDLI